MELNYIINIFDSFIIFIIFLKNQFPKFDFENYLIRIKKEESHTYYIKNHLKLNFKIKCLDIRIKKKEVHNDAKLYQD